MKLKELGRFLELPISGLSIKKIVFDGFLTLVFTDAEESFLEITAAFTVERHHYTSTMLPADKEGFLFFHEHFREPIKEAKADRQGNLWLTFSNGITLAIEDGPYENWHYTKHSLTTPTTWLRVHGGAGQTYS
jgi:hypothetical protein